MTKKIIKQFFLITTMILFTSIFKTNAFAETGYEIQGNVKGLTIIVNFSDLVTTSTESDIENLLNEPGYSANGNNGSIRDYFYNVSYGELEYTNKVITYNARETKQFYDNIVDPEDKGAQADVLAKEALDYIAANNPSAFTGLTTQNGEVALTLLYAGPSVSSGPSGLWPHKGTIDNLEYYNDQQEKFNFNKFIISSIGNIPYIGTIAHETGHMLCNWPDTYMPTGNGCGDYDLMANGCSINDEKNPAWPNPYFRCLLSGWGNIMNLNNYTNNSDLIASSYYHDVYMFTPDSQDKYSPNEFFLIENMNHQGMPDAGLIIWHIDKLYSSHTLPAPYNNKTPNLVSVVQADGLYSLERKQNMGLEGDLFSRYGVNSFTTNTPVNSNLWDGTPSYLYITNITNSGTAMGFRYSKATDIEKPTAPSNVRTINRNGLEIQLNWDSSTDNVGIYGYHVYAYVTTLTGTYRQDIGYPTGNSLNFTMETDKTYSFYVTSTDIQRNDSAPSSAFDFSTNTLAPEAPTNLTYSLSEVTSNSVNLAWSKSTSTFGNVRYKIYDGTTIIGDTDNIYFAAKDLSPNTSYSFTVKAYVPSYESIALSSSSNAVQVITRAAAVNNFRLTNYTGLQAHFTWDASAGAAKYHLYGTKQSTLTFQYPIDIDFYNTNPFYILNLQPNTYYKFYVKAVDASGYESDVSNEIIICTDNITPEAITNLTASDITSNSVKLSWSCNSDPLRLRRYQIFDGTSLVDEISETNITLTGLTINTTHIYTVIAVGFNKTSSLPSNSISVTTKIPAPTNFHCVYAGGLEIKLGWDSTDGADHYRIYADKIASDGTTTYREIFQDNITGATTTITVPAGFNYTFYLVAVDANGTESAPSNTTVSLDALPRI